MRYTCRLWIKKAFDVKSECVLYWKLCNPFPPKKKCVMENILEWQITNLQEVMIKLVDYLFEYIMLSKNLMMHFIQNLSILDANVMSCVLIIVSKSHDCESIALHLKLHFYTSWYKINFLQYNFCCNSLIQNKYIFVKLFLWIHS